MFWYRSRKRGGSQALVARFGVLSENLQEFLRQSHHPTPAEIWFQRGFLFHSADAHTAKCKGPEPVNACRSFRPISSPTQQLWFIESWDWMAIPFCDAHQGTWFANRRWSQDFVCGSLLALGLQLEMFNWMQISQSVGGSVLLVFTPLQQRDRGTTV